MFLYNVNFLIGKINVHKCAILFDYVDGQPLLFSEIEKDLPDHSVKLLSESKWTFITQEVNNMYASYFCCSCFHIFLLISFLFFFCITSVIIVNEFSNIETLPNCTCMLSL